MRGIRLWISTEVLIEYKIDNPTFYTYVPFLWVSLPEQQT